MQCLYASQENTHLHVLKEIATPSNGPDKLRCLEWRCKNSDRSKLAGKRKKEVQLPLKPQSGVLPFSMPPLTPTASYTLSMTGLT
mmetsp:Transcript_41182/g.104746  ORF Transcript_41182/g.104746 Transcript_41182/m.104746 type:complete len:85 (-) Transcript_41182:402-656(-)